MTNLKFGTAGLRGPMQAGPDGMNIDVVITTTAAICAWLRDRCLGGGTVVVGFDARHQSREFATAAAEVFAGAGFRVVALPRPLPTPVTAFAVKKLDAVAGVQITASHNPKGDNGYKVYVSGGTQLNVPADREIEQLMGQVGPVDSVARTPVTLADDSLFNEYLERVASLARGEHRDLRIAITALHGVGGGPLVRALTKAGFHDVRAVVAQQEPNPDFPTVDFPNPEEYGTSDKLIALAKEMQADLALALDPDADRCAAAIPAPGGWRKLTGDEVGALLGDFILETAAPDSLVATSVVSSRLLGKIAAARGARYAETLTGFKWLARTGPGLVFAYEEAIGYCVDPAAVRDKDGISAAVVLACLAARTKAEHRGLADLLADLDAEFGVHRTGQVSRWTASASETMGKLRASPPVELCGEAVRFTDLSTVRGPMRTDALVFEGETVRVVVRPSGTEPKLKCYLEATGPDAAGNLTLLSDYCASL